MRKRTPLWPSFTSSLGPFTASSSPLAGKGGTSRFQDTVSRSRIFAVNIDTAMDIQKFSGFFEEWEFDLDAWKRAQDLESVACASPDGREATACLPGGQGRCGPRTVWPTHARFPLHPSAPCLHAQESFQHANLSVWVPSDANIVDETPASTELCAGRGRPRQKPPTTPAEYVQGGLENIHWDLTEYLWSLENLAENLSSAGNRSARFFAARYVFCEAQARYLPLTFSPLSTPWPQQLTPRTFTALLPKPANYTSGPRTRTRPYLARSSRR
jgi:hypothetical protein